MAITLVFILFLSFTERFRDFNNNRIAQHNRNSGQRAITTKQSLFKYAQAEPRARPSNMNWSGYRRASAITYLDSRSYKIL